MLRKTTLDKKRLQNFRCFFNLRTSLCVAMWLVATPRTTTSLISTATGCFSRALIDPQKLKRTERIAHHHLYFHLFSFGRRTALTCRGSQCCYYLTNPRLSASRPSQIVSRFCSSGSDDDIHDKQQVIPVPSSFSSSDWQSSNFAIHVAIAEQHAPTTVENAVDRALTGHHVHRRHKEKNSGGKRYTSRELLELGSVWYLASLDMNNPYKKPHRLSLNDAHFSLQTGDYLRIHHDPRRFPAVDRFDWTVTGQEGKDGDMRLPRVVVEHNLNSGYIVLNKPPECIPVHPTVDNAIENIAACLRRANPNLTYLTTPQRLDQNTSGLITLASSKNFSAYYAQLLRHKTAQEIPNNKRNKQKDEEINNLSVTGIQKRYRCLVCLMPPHDPKNSWSVNIAIRILQSYVRDGTVLRHYLEPSIRAPKRFVSTPPVDHDDNNNSWAECLLRIINVGDVCTLKGNAPSTALAEALWSSASEAMPPQCHAVVEIEVELITGRTHQIRGQLSAEGFPLVADVPYGGAVPKDAPQCNKYNSRIGLQCCRLEFLDPDYKREEKTSKGGTKIIDTKMVPSNRWNSFQLDLAWWSPLIEQYHKETKKLLDTEMATMAALDIGLVGEGSVREKQKQLQQATRAELNPEGLPPQALLSPGRHKYVIVKASDPNTGEIFRWFVKSASPQECGGPCHKDVAKDLCEWIEACGYRATVTGGGRILYQAENKRALVYGFSYGFGRGDHALAVKVIKEWSNFEMDAAYDDSLDLY